MLRIWHPAAAFLCAALSAQQTLWVEPVNGNDSNPGSYTQPLRTLTNAVTLAGPNARIHLLAGIYGPQVNGERLPITLGGGLLHDNLVIRGIGTVVFDLGGATVPAMRFGSGANGTRVTNITFSNSDQNGWWTLVMQSGTGVNSANSANFVEIDRCRFHNVNRGLVLWTADNVQGWRIHDNVFWNLTNDAILEYTGTNEVYNNTFHTGTWKAYISDSSTTVCANNLIVGYNIAFENNNAANNPQRYRNNWIYQTTTVHQGVGLAAGLPASNTVGVDPLLVNPGLGDFHLQAQSPLREAGDPAVFARADLDANSRLVDSDVNGSLLPEIGAYEATPVAMSASFDPQTRLLTIGTTATGPGAGLLGFVLFSFDDGLVTFPGQGPILIDQNSFIPAWLSGPFPGNWILNLGGVPPFPPGTRLVMHVLGAGTSGPLIGGNQVWLQL